MPAFGNRVLTSTQDKIWAKLVDGVLKQAVLASRILRRAKRFSGERMKFPFKTATNTNLGSFQGFDQFPTTAANNRINLEFFSTNDRVTSALPFDEMWANEGDGKVLDLNGLTLKSDIQDFLDHLGTIFYGDGTGNSDKDFLGLEAIVDRLSLSFSY